MPIDERFQIQRLCGEGSADDFAEDVRRGLLAAPKFLLPKYLYDDIGSALFEVITLLPEYYPTRAESRILEQHADEIARIFNRKIELVELGSGSSTKTRMIIEALLRRQDALKFVPIDISPHVLEEGARVLLQLYPKLSIEAVAADYFTALKCVKFDAANRTLALFLGGNIGNFTRMQADEFLTALRSHLQPGDALLLGADLKKSKQILEDAYDDPTGVTAAFNINLLGRLNRELAGDFDLRGFRHRAVYNELEGRVEMHLESLREQTVCLKKLGLCVRFVQGERIHTENSHKYSIDDLTELAARNGFQRVESWFDDKKLFSSNLLRAV